MISSTPAFLCALASPLLPHDAVSWLDGFVLLYVGPDQILPLTSFLGAVVGVLLMFWNRVVGVFLRIKKFCSRR